MQTIQYSKLCWQLSNGHWSSCKKLGADAAAATMTHITPTNLSESQTPPCSDNNHASQVKVMLLSQQVKSLATQEQNEYPEEPKHQAVQT